MRAQARGGERTQNHLPPMESHARTERGQKTTENHQSHRVTKYTSKLIN